MQVRIYKPTKSAMQSGLSNTKHWILEFSGDKARFIEPVMEWTGSKNMLNEVKIKFGTKEEAIEFANTNNYSFEVIEPQIKKIVKRSYADNFK